MRSRDAVSIWCSEGIGFAAGLGAACLGFEWNGLGGASRAAVVTILVLGSSALIFFRWRAGREPKSIPPTVDLPIVARVRTEPERAIDRPSSLNPGAVSGTRSTGSASELLKGASSETNAPGENLYRTEETKAAAPSEAAQTSNISDLADPLDLTSHRFATNVENRSGRYQEQESGESSPVRVAGDQLVEIWETCRREGGDLIAELRQRYGAGVHPGQEVGAANYTVAIESGDPRRLFLLPEVGAAIRALGDYFAAAGGSATRLARVQRVIEPAVVRRNSEGFEIQHKGTVE